MVVMGNFLAVVDMGCLAACTDHLSFQLQPYYSLEPLSLATLHMKNSTML